MPLASCQPTCMRGALRFRRRAGLCHEAPGGHERPFRSASHRPTPASYEHLERSARAGSAADAVTTAALSTTLTATLATAALVAYCTCAPRARARARPQEEAEPPAKKKRGRPKNVKSSETAEGAAALAAADAETATLKPASLRTVLMMCGHCMTSPVIYDTRDVFSPIVGNREFFSGGTFLLACAWLPRGILVVRSIQTLFTHSSVSNNICSRLLSTDR